MPSDSVTRAFLSHSSRDKEAVEAVALALGRQYCVYDKFAFETGDDFRTAIRTGLAASKVFVLFFSRHSRDSVWVGFEAREAELQSLGDYTSRALVYLIDSAVGIEDLPEWLRRSKVTREIAPSTIARDIREHIDGINRQARGTYFVGRTKEMALVQRALTPIGAPPPRVLVLSGLPGIGRKTLAAVVGKNLLSVGRTIVFKVSPGDTVRDLLLKVADLLEPYSTPERLAELKQQIVHLDAESVLPRLRADLSRAAGSGELPVLQDDGGMLDNDGHFSPDIQAILNLVEQNRELYLCLVTERRPRETVPTSPLPHVRVDPLTEDDVKVLLSSMANRIDITLTASELAVLAAAIGGFPPSAYFAVYLLEAYGVSAIVNSTRPLVSDRAMTFVRHLKELDLAPEAIAMLKALSAVGPLPLQVLGESLGLDPEQTTKILMNLMDAALVVATDRGLYAIADPVSDAVFSEFGYDPSLYSRVAARLSDALATENVEAGRMELQRVLHRAYTLSGDKTFLGKADMLVSDWVDLGKRFYFSREFALALELFAMAVEQRPDNVGIRMDHIRALIQEEYWDGARAALDDLRRKGAVKEADYLLGFLERKRNANLPAAVKAYEAALARGFRGVAIHRELALCYFNLRNFERARYHIDRAEEHRFGARNPYVVDLKVLIATSQGDEPTARSQLRILEDIDQTAFSTYRSSTVEFAFGSRESALELASEAIASISKPTFDMLAQRIKCETATGRLDLAREHLVDLDGKFARTHEDRRTCLWIQWEVAHGAWRNAMGHWERLLNKDNVVHQYLRRVVLRGLLQHDLLPDAERSQFEAEIAVLDRELERVAGELYDDLRDDASAGSTTPVDEGD